MRLVRVEKRLARLAGRRRGAETRRIETGYEDRGIDEGDREIDKEDGGIDEKNRDARKIER